MKKSFKKIISGALAALTLSSAMTIGSFAANQKLSLNEKTSVNVKKTVALEFTPKESGDYMFYSSCGENDNPYASLYVSESGGLKKIGSGDNNEKSSNFEVYATLKKGKKYILKCSDSSRMGDKKYTVSVKKSPVKSIKFTPYEPIKICLNDRAHGKYKTISKNGRSVTYFEYDLTDLVFKNKNEITVNYNNGKKSVTFDYGYHTVHSFTPGWSGSSCGDIYGNEKEDITLDDSKIKITTTQSTKHWDKVGTYYFTLTVFGKNVKVPVVIEKSPVKKIEFFSSEKINHVGKPSELSGQTPEFSSGDRLKVTYNDKRGTVEYKFGSYTENGFESSGQAFVDKNGFPIFGVTISKVAKGSDGKYYSKVSYLGKTTKFTYNCVSASDIKISFTSEYPLTVAENDELFGYKEDWGSNSFVYNAGRLIFAPGNKITVTVKNSTTVYSYDAPTDCFISNDGCILNEYNLSDNQEKSPWKVGGKNTISLNVYGATCKIPVKVIKCSHKNTVTTKEVVATCEKDGWTEGKRCSTCHAYISGHEVIYARHNTKPEFKWVGDKAYATVKCTVCKKTVYMENKRVDNVTVKVTEKATMKKDGKLVRKARFLFGSDEPYYAKKTETIRKIGSVTLSETSFTYNGKVQKPSVTVKDADGKALKKGVDFTLTYSDISSAKTGKYSIKVIFTGKYEGTKTLTYKIVK